MEIFEKPLKEIVLADIERLVENKVPENLHLEYKFELPSNSDDGKKEFLADVSSFANAFGGLILYGLKEDKNDQNQNLGYPASIEALQLENTEKEIQRLESIVRDGIEPKLTAFEFKKIVSDDGKNILALKIQKSLIGPHITWFRKSGKFFKRVGTSKTQLDVHEIRNAFLQNDEFQKQYIDFVESRVVSIRSGGFLGGLDIDGSTIIHIIPLTGEKNIDFGKVTEPLELKFKPLGYDGWDRHYNFEGYLVANLRDEHLQSYNQFFRNGVLEIYTSLFHLKREENGNLFRATQFESKVLEYIKQYIGMMSILGVSFPLLIAINIFDLESYRFVDPNNDFFDHQNMVGRSHVPLPSALIRHENQNLSDAMKFTFDVLWQSKGFKESPNYSKRNEKY